MDIYDLAVKLTLANRVTGGLTTVINQFTSLQVDIRNTQTVLQSFQAALGASISWRAGKDILRGMGRIVAAGGTILDQQALMLAAGWKQKDVAEMTAAAYRQAASVMAATPASALKALDIQGAFVNRKTGQFEVAAYKAGMHELVALMLAIPHTLDMNQLMLFTRMAGPAAQAMNFQDYARTYGEVIASMGCTGGRGLQMLYKTFLGGNISKALADELTRAGVVKAGAIRHIKGSSRNILDYHGIVGWKELTTNAADWAHDVLFPMLAAHGFQGVPGMMRALGSLPVTVQRLLSFLLTNWAQVERGKETIERAEKADGYETTAAKSWRLNVQNFEAGWTGLMRALGDPAATAALPLLKDVTAGIKGLTELLEDHPNFSVLLDSPGTSIGLLVAIRGLRTAPLALRGLGAGLLQLARGLGLFAAGEEAAGSLALLSTGLPELAAGLIGFTGVVGGLMDMYGKALGTHPLRTAEPTKRLADAMAKAHAENEYRMTRGSPAGFRWTPPPVPKMYQRAYEAKRSSAMPLPPGAGVHVSVSSPVTVTLPLPPMSPADLQHALQMALIQGIDPNTLAKLADMIAQEQAHALEPLLQKVIQKELQPAVEKQQKEQKRRSFIGPHAFGRGDGPQ